MLTRVYRGYGELTFNTKTLLPGRMDTKGINSPVYGWFEARMETVPTNGIMSAWWMWPDNGTWDYRQSQVYSHQPELVKCKG